jgi:hypothetical protein
VRGLLRCAESTPPIEKKTKSSRLSIIENGTHVVESEGTPVHCILPKLRFVFGIKTGFTDCSISKENDPILRLHRLGKEIWVVNNRVITSVAFEIGFIPFFFVAALDHAVARANDTLRQIGKVLDQINE